MPKHIPALANRAAFVASTAATAALLSVLPATPAAAAPAAPAPAPAVVSTRDMPIARIAPVVQTAPVPAVVTAPAPAIANLPTATTASAMRIAMSKLGSPYVYGAAGPNSFDCSGLMQWAFKQAGIVLPRVAAAQATVGVPVAKADLRPGDLVFFYRPISHVAMYIGNGQVVHASTSGQPVKISQLANMPFAAARRI